MASEQDRLPAVGWLMSRALVQKLQKILLYSLFGDRMDHRDWMVPQVVRFVHPESELSPPISTPPLETGRQAVLSKDIHFAGDEFWFDYISDTGDGGSAVEAVAILARSQYNVAELERNQRTKELKTDPSVLPRGQFLLIGGDTAYHVADVVTLEERFRRPFNAAEKSGDRAPPRALFAIPGNHDYYDALIGYNKQFRAPLNVDGGPLALEGYRTFQEGSYFALSLPYGWEIWALDAEGGDVDYRQGRFFRDRRSNVKRLMLVTPEPAVALGRYLGQQGAYREEYESGLEKIGLNPRDPLESLSARLDLAGDIHHYARHTLDADTPESTSGKYMSVVAGCGGAFLHPTHLGLPEGSTVIGGPEKARLKVTALEPSVEESRKECRVVPWKLGWGVSLLGACFAAAIAVAVTKSPTVCSLVSAWPGLGGLRATCRPIVSVAEVPIWGWATFALAGLVGVGLLVALMTDKESKDNQRESAKLKKWRLVAAGLGLPAVPLVWGLLDFNPLPLPVPDWFQTHALVSLVLLLAVVVTWRLKLNRHWNDLRERMVMHPDLGADQIVAQPTGGNKATWLAIAVFLALGCAAFHGPPVGLLAVDVLAWLVVGFVVILVLYARSANGHMRDRMGIATILGGAHGLLHLAVTLVVLGCLVTWWSSPKVLVPAAALVGALSGPIIFTLYLRAAGSARLHFNEIGAAVRSENFKHLLRFRLTAAGLECFVLQVPDAKAFLASKATAKPLHPRLVDYFQIG
jgi:hypothetical protein